MSDLDQDFPYTPIQLAWLHDLETTTAKQGKHLLRSENNKFCCLGRACEVMGLPSSLHKDEYTEFRYRYQGEDLGFEDLALPASAMEKLQLRSISGILKRPHCRGLSIFTTLAALNDDGVSFREIAAFIRSDPTNVFTNLDGHPASSP